MTNERRNRKGNWHVEKNNEIREKEHKDEKWSKKIKQERWSTRKKINNKTINQIRKKLEKNKSTQRRKEKNNYTRSRIRKRKICKWRRKNKLLKTKDR